MAGKSTSLVDRRGADTRVAGAVVVAGAARFAGGLSTAGVAALRTGDLTGFTGFASGNERTDTDAVPNSFSHRNRFSAHRNASNVTSLETMRRGVAPSGRRWMSIAASACGIGSSISVFLIRAVSAYR